MATRAIVLNQAGDNLEIAFYYLVPTQFRSAAARDSTRVVQGESTGILSQQEIQAIKNGIAIEYIYQLNVAGMSLEAIRDRIESEYTAQRTTALRQYTDQYSFTRYYWDSESGWQVKS